MLAVGLRDVDGGTGAELDAPVVLRLGGVDVATARELVAWRGLAALPAEAIGLVHAATGGNPLHLLQVLAAVAVDPGAAGRDPGSLGQARLRDRVVEQRFRRLSGDGQAVLAAASVVGREVTLPVLARMLKRSLVAAARSLEEVARSGLLISVGVGRYRFTLACCTVHVRPP